MAVDQIGPEGRRYFPFIFTLFFFVLMGNLLGLVPFSFTYTSHIAITLALALLVIVMVTAVALAEHGWKFFTYFFPDGAPVFLAPLIVPIEIISYLSRPVSLSIRLFANMVAGHVMFAVFATFVVMLGGAARSALRGPSGRWRSTSCSWGSNCWWLRSRPMCSRSSPASTCMTRCICTKLVPA